LIIDSHSLLADAVIQLLSSLTLSPDDAHNLIRVVVDSTELQSPSTLETPQPPAPHPTTQIHLATSPIVTPASTSQTPVPTAQTKSPTPLVVKTLQPPVSLPVPTSSILPTTTTTFNGEERRQQQYNGFTFDIPSADANGPFYLVNRGRRVGVFDTWCSFFLTLIPVSDIESQAAHFPPCDWGENIFV
jgi:hypothetical protein